MKNIWESKSNMYNFILYKNKLSPPRYFKINKFKFKFFLYGLPIITITSLIITVSGLTHLKALRQIVKKREPQIFSELRESNQKAKQQISNLKKLTFSLEEKLGKVDTSKGEMGWSSYFKIPPGFTNLTSTPIFGLESIEHFIFNDQLLFNFNIANLTATQDSSKKAGRLFIVARYDNSLHFFPDNLYSQDEMKISYTKGEYFVTSRFRPVKAIFSIPKRNQTIIFQVFIFSRKGDLLLSKMYSRNIKF